MQRHAWIVRAIAVGTLAASSGCQLLSPLLSGSRTAAQGTNLGSVVVAAYQLAPKRIAIPAGGLTLRRALSEGLDQADTRYMMRDLINSTSVQEALAGALQQGGQPTGEYVGVGSGTQAVVIIRGLQRLFIPQRIIDNSIVGNVRVLPGDSIFTIPALSAPLSKYASIDPVSDQPVAYFLRYYGGALTATQTQPVSTPGKFDAIASVINLERMFTDNSSFDRAIANALLLTRTNGKFVDQYVIPLWFGEGARSLGSGLDSFENEPAFDGLIQAGDVIDITRVELIPAIRARLRSRLPSA